MKKAIVIVIVMLVALLGSQNIYAAESYQRWIYWVNEPNHIATASEMADITAALANGTIVPTGTYKLSSGVTYRIPQPNLYLEYIVMCIKVGEPSIVTTQDVINAIGNGEVVRWGDDISYKVKNYYFSTRYNEVRFIGNYSGSEKGIYVLLINGKPKIKMNCGNPLGIYDEKYTPKYVQSVAIPDTVTVHDTLWRVVMMEEKEDLPPQTTVIVEVYQNQPQYSYGYYQPFSCQMNYAPFYPQPMGQQMQQSCNNVTNVYNNTTNINNIDNSRITYTHERPEPVDPGGPAPVPGHGDGGPAPVPGHDDNNTGGGPNGSGGFDETLTKSSLASNQNTGRNSVQKNESNQRASSNSSEQGRSTKSTSMESRNTGVSTKSRETSSPSTSGRNNLAPLKRSNSSEARVSGSSNQQSRQTQQVQGRPQQTKSSYSGQQSRNQQIQRQSGPQQRQVSYQRAQAQNRPQMRSAQSQSRPSGANRGNGGSRPSVNRTGGRR